MHSLKYLNKFFWRYRGRLFMGALFITLFNLGNVYAPEVVKEGVKFLQEVLAQKDEVNSTATTSLQLPRSLQLANGVLKGDSSAQVTLSQADYKDKVIEIGLLLAGFYLLLYLVKGVFLFYQRQTIIVMSRYIEYDLKNEIYDQYQRLDMAFYKQHRTGDLMNRISEDVNRVRMYLGPAVMYTINLIILAIFCIAFMWKVDAELTLYTLAPMPFMMIAIFYVSTRIHRKSEQVQQQQSRLSSFIQESMAGIRVLKSFNQSGQSQHSFDGECNEYKKRQLKLVKVDALFMPVIFILVGLSTALTIYVGGQKVIAGQIELGVLFQFVFYVNLLTWPFASVGWVTSLTQKAEASQKRINEFLQTKPRIVENDFPIKPINGRIEFNNVSFTYPDSGTEALKNVSFTVEQGKTLAIIGKTGSGKSTIASLLLRMYEPVSGEIKLDNIPLHRHRLHHVRKNIGYVPQDVFLFSDSIANNISFGVDTKNENEIEEASTAADLHHNVLAFQSKYDTLLGERGINLSGGQKQRVAIARALIKKPAILLFDDCLSAVDTQTEENILQSLKKEMAGKTSIIISHRISSIKQADKIIVLDHGRIVEQGTHDVLLAANGAYASLYRKQLLEEELT